MVLKIISPEQQLIYQRDITDSKQPGFFQQELAIWQILVYADFANISTFHYTKFKNHIFNIMEDGEICYLMTF